MVVKMQTGFKGTTYPLTHGRVCWNWTTDGTITASTAASGFPATNAMPPRTDTAWRPTAATGQWVQTFSAERVVSFVGIAKHDLGTQNATFKIEYQAPGSATWVEFAGSEQSPAHDGVILFLAFDTAADAVRVNITAADAAPTISVIAVGEASEWPRPFVWTGQPITEGDRIGYENTITNTGNWIGRTKVDDGLQFNLEMQHASETWRQTEFAAFKEHANGDGATFFVALRPLDYPDEVAYAWLTDTALADRSIPNRRISTSMNLQCQGLRPNG